MFYTCVFYYLGEKRLFKFFNVYPTMPLKNKFPYLMYRRRIWKDLPPQRKIKRGQQIVSLQLNSEIRKWIYSRKKRKRMTPQRQPTGKSKLTWRLIQKGGNSNSLQHRKITQIQRKKEKMMRRCWWVWRLLHSKHPLKWLRHCNLKVRKKKMLNLKISKLSEW